MLLTGRGSRGGQKCNTIEEIMHHRPRKPGQHKNIKYLREMQRKLFQIVSQAIGGQAHLFHYLSLLSLLPLLSVLFRLSLLSLYSFSTLSTLSALSTLCTLYPLLSIPSLLCILHSLYSAYFLHCLYRAHLSCSCHDPEKLPFKM